MRMPKQNHSAWWNGIVFRSMAAVTLIAVLLGGVASVVIRETLLARVNQEAQQRLVELLDTVESTASVAAYANDELLAGEVVQGLSRNGEVLRATIISGSAQLAQSSSRPISLDATQPPITRALPSPFKKGTTIGEIRLDGNWQAIASRAERTVRDVMLMLFGLLVLVMLGAATMVFVVVVRPIKATSDRLHRLDGASGKVLRVPDGHQKTEIGRLVGDINDLTGRLGSTLRQERDLRQQQEIAKRMYQDLFDHASSGIFVADPTGSLASFNTAFAKLTWLPRSGERLDRHLSEARWGSFAKLMALVGRAAKLHALCEDDFQMRGLRGDERWLHVAVLPLGDGSVQGTLTDVTERKRGEMSARRLAVTDSLTGFANRDGLLQQFASLDAATSAPCAVIMIDLEGFKQVNDAMGFPVGDQVLLKVAERIREADGEADFFARIGGDEFVVVLADMSQREAVSRRVEALLARLREPYVLDRGAVPVGASVGIALFAQDGADMPQLLRSAELALGSVREANRTVGSLGYAFFDPQMQAAVEHRRRLEDDLRQVVKTGGLRLAFQPIVDLKAGRVVGAEALLRWQHPQRGFVPPDVFIPLAESVGLIGDIGRKVLDDACRQVAIWRRDGLDLYVSVNVSGSQIPDELTPEAVIETLRRHALPAQAIALEITEGVLMSDVDIAQRWIESLRSAGLRIYLDDFGTGYSSLSYLKRFQMDTVKVDKSFVMDMTTSDSARALVEAIIHMAASLGLKVVAEGIEDADQLAMLRKMGCGYGQGYVLSRPVPAADFVDAIWRINADLVSYLTAPAPLD